jgi:hypothetical protein
LIFRLAPRLRAARVTIRHTRVGKLWFFLFGRPRQLEIRQTSPRLTFCWFPKLLLLLTLWSPLWMTVQLSHVAHKRRFEVSRGTELSLPIQLNRQLIVIFRGQACVTLCNTFNAKSLYSVVMYN